MEVDEPNNDRTTSTGTGHEQQPEVQPQQQMIQHRSLPKSKRWWKKTQTTRPLTSTKPKSGWEKKMQEKSMKKQVRTLQQEIRQKMSDEKAGKVQAKKEKEERRKQNQLKAEVVQVIKNPAKLKRMKKKQLRMVQKRDITTATAKWSRLVLLLVVDLLFTVLFLM